MSSAFIILACATCYGDPNSSQSQGVTAAVWFMVGTIGVVLAGMSAVLLGFVRRARRLELQQGV